MVVDMSASASAGDLLTQGITSAKSNADLMQMCWKVIHTDENLRETLKTAQAKLHEWESAAKGVPEKLHQEVETLRSELDTATAARRSYLVEKRKLQMSIKDEKRKAENAEKKLSEIMEQLEKSSGGDLEAKVKVLEAEMVGARRDLEELDILKAEAEELRGNVALLTTQLEAEKEEGRREQGRVKELERNLAEAENKAQKGLPSPASTDALHHAPAAPARPPRAPERTKRTKEPKEPTKEAKQDTIPLTPPVLGAGSVVLLVVGFLLGSLRKGGGGGGGNAGAAGGESSE